MCTKVFFVTWVLTRARIVFYVRRVQTLSSTSSPVRLSHCQIENHILEVFTLAQKSYLKYI